MCNKFAILLLQCEFDTADSPTSIRHQLSLAAPPSVRLAPASGQLTAVQGEDAELGCEAGGRPPARVTWHRGQHSAKGQASSTPLSSGAVLPLTNLTRHHEGLYTCVADNGVGGPVIQTIALTIACKHNCARSIYTK